MANRPDKSSRPVTRRAFFSSTLVAGAGLVAWGGRGTAAQPPAGFIPAEFESMGTLARRFLQTHRVPGLSVAIAKAGRLVYSRGFGLADKENNREVTPRHLFRIASLSKPITATAIYRLAEAGKLRLSDKVFGPGAILGTDYGSPPFPRYLEEITVDQLLVHTAGGWPNDSTDPMFRHPEMSREELIAWTLSHEPPQHPPGTRYAYSNFGFCLLGRIIEKRAGKTYAEGVQEWVLAPCGISDMRIGGSRRAERLLLEVVYYSQDDSDPYGLDLGRIDAHGGWLATAEDLVRFLVHVDGFPTVKDILSPGSIEGMTTSASVSPNYARGWCVNQANNWWHTGSLPGTTALMARTASQFCWAALANTRDGADILGDLDRLVWEMVGKVTTWPAGRPFERGPIRLGAPGLAQPETASEHNLQHGHHQENGAYHRV